MHFRSFLRFALFLAVIGLIVGQGSLYAQSSSPVASGAQTTVYLPLVSAPGTPDSDPGSDPYADMVARAAAICPHLQVNQGCVVGGTVAGQTKTGPINIATPGATIDLAAVERITTAAPSADSATWGIVRLRLRSNAELDLLAFGGVDLRIGALAESAEAVPSLMIDTTPTPDSAGRMSSGVVVQSLAGEPGTLLVNEATITMASAVYISHDRAPGLAETAQPTGDDDLLVPLTVAVTEGVAQVSAAGSDQIVTQGQKVHVPLNANGQAAGSPTTPIDVLITDFLFNIIVPFNLVQQQQLTDAIIGRLETAIDRCVAGRTSSIYSVIFWNRIINGTEFIQALLSPARRAAVHSRVPDCLSFEVEFDSMATTQGGPISESSHLRATQIPVRFDHAGKLLAGEQVPLQYISHTFISPSPCGLSTVTLDGALRAESGSMRVAVNEVGIDITLALVGLPGSVVTAHCPHTSIDVSFDQWRIAFPQLHRDIWQPGDPHLFRFANWHYTAGISTCEGAGAAQCDHVGETSYQREETASGITYSGDTHLILVHAPKQ